jgi:hypothetical protein
MLNPCECCGSAYHSTDGCTHGHLEVELIRAARSDEKHQSLLWDLIAAIDADGCKRLHAGFPPTGLYEPIVASAIEKVAGLRAELAALRRHQFRAAIEALRAFPEDNEPNTSDICATWAADWLESKALKLDPEADARRRLGEWLTQDGNCRRSWYQWVPPSLGVSVDLIVYHPNKNTVHHHGHGADVTAAINAALDAAEAAEREEKP